MNRSDGDRAGCSFSCSPARGPGKGDGSGKGSDPGTPGPRGSRNAGLPDRGAPRPRDSRMPTGNIRSEELILADLEWTRTKDQLVQTLVRLGFREDLGLAIAKNLGSPKAMERMISYLVNVRPRKEELVIDEMLAICSEIAMWREKKASQEANARYNEILNYGLED